MEPAVVRARIETIMSGILSDRYGCKVTYRFISKEEAKAKEGQYDAISIRDLR